MGMAMSMATIETLVVEDRVAHFSWGPSIASWE